MNVCENVYWSDGYTTVTIHEPTMDPNHNMYSNMGAPVAMSPNSSLNSSFQAMTPEQLLQLQQINQQQIQALTAQLAHTHMLGSPVSPMSPDAFGMSYSQVPTMPAGNQGLLSASTTGPSIAGVPFMPATSSVAPLSPVIGHIPLNASINIANNGQMPVFQHNTSDYNPIAYPNTPAGINSQLPNQIQVQVPNPTGQYKPNAVRNVAAPDTLYLQHTNQPRTTSYSSSSYSSSPASTPQDSPAMPKRPTALDQVNGPTFMQRPRQRVSSPPPVKPPSERGGSTSSASIPGSPSSSGYPPLSPDGSWSDTSGPLSPDGTPRKMMNGDARGQMQQIKNKPLQRQTKYPQDKCYSCMKRVYPMEKLGPVRDVVYHKGCFRCKTCNTQLHLKNFFHNQSDNFDLSVYCKSHQPMSEKGPKLGTDSLEIKGALTVPKQGHVTTESERVPVHAYSYDIMCREIEHARKAPVQDLQSGVKARNNAWSKSKREHYNAPTGNVVRAEDPVPEYNEEEYTRHQVENEPDYT